MPPGSHIEQGEMMGVRGILQTGSWLGRAVSSAPGSAPQAPASTATQTHPTLLSWPGEPAGKS